MGNNYTHGKTVRYSCNLGYTLEGEAELTCVDGRWNTVTPKCKGMRSFLFSKKKNSLVLILEVKRVVLFATFQI